MIKESLITSCLILGGCKDNIKAYGEFTPIVESFLEEGRERGVVFDYTHMPYSIEYGVMQKNQLAMCINREKILVNQEYWSGMSAHCKELVLFHELGHCVLDLGHSSYDEDIMYPSTDIRYGCDDYYRDRTRRIDRLFNRSN